MIRFLALVFLVHLCWHSVAQVPHHPDDPYYVSGGAINIAVSAVDASEGNAFFSAAEQNERDGDYNEAVMLFSKAAFEYNSAKQLSRYGSALMRLSNVHYLLNNYTEAEQVVLNVALKNYTKLGSRSGQMESYGQLGKIYLAANKLTQSLWFYTQQGILARQLGSSSGNIESVLGIAKVKVKKKEYIMASRDINHAELLAKAANIRQFSDQIKEVRSQIPLARKKS